MQQVQGVWLPDGDTHFAKHFGPKLYKRPTYQIDKFLGCLPYIKTFGHCVDVGAHCGIWSMVMQRCFRQLTAFEPLPHHAECWRKNVSKGTLHEVALGDGSKETLKIIVEKDNSGMSRVADNGNATVPVKTLDSFCLDSVDFIKIDCEYYEWFVVNGAHWTIRRDRPCILLEEVIGATANSARDLLMSWGFEVRWTQGHDHCLSWHASS